MIYVIGSGPAGVSAAVALIKTGHRVTMLDVGYDLERHFSSIRQKLCVQRKEEWDGKVIQDIKNRTKPHAGGVKQKLIFGSDYCYKGMEIFQPIVQNNAKIYRSFAIGGLSNVWGGAILPFRDEDIKDWPIAFDDLEGYYKDVLSFMPNSGSQDDFCQLFPKYFTKISNYRQSKQSISFNKDLKKHKKGFNYDGIYFGRSRLAVDFNADYSEKSCVYCGLCLYGCPYELIYSSALTLKQLIKADNFLYIPNIMVEKLSEEAGSVKIEAKSINDNSFKIFEGTNVFLGAGVFSSTRIMLNSLKWYNKDIEVKHSDHFQIPMIRFKNVPLVTQEQMHTLTQMTLALVDKDISENTVNMQVYAYNDLYKRVLEHKFDFLPNSMNFLMNFILGRLLIIKGYLHSSISSKLKVKLVDGENGKLIVRGVSNPVAKRALKKINKKLLLQTGRMKTAPVFFASKLGLPGEANHSGGSFPMRKTPKHFESDTLGRPFGFKHVYLIDSSVFPSIPATTITLTIMANAYRIASNFEDG